MSTKYKVIVEYDGTGFAGWQIQDSRTRKPTVAGAITEAIHQFCGERPTIHAAGRTDAGVHATAMTAHFELNRKTTPREIMGALGFHLSKSGGKCSIIKASRARPDFHARFSCKGREYIYKILNRPARPALLENRAWHVATELNIEEMKEAAKHLIGHHDFSSFRGSGCQSSSPLKTLDSIVIKKRGEIILVEVKAQSFLYHQVRNIVGTLKLVGEGKITPEDVKKILKAKSRPAAGPTAPAEGLYFAKARY